MFEVIGIIGAYYNSTISQVGVTRHSCQDGVEKTNICGS